MGNRTQVKGGGRRGHKKRKRGRGGQGGVEGPGGKMEEGRGGGGGEADGREVKGKPVGKATRRREKPCGGARPPKKGAQKNRGEY